MNPLTDDEATTLAEQSQGELNAAQVQAAYTGQSSTLINLAKALVVSIKALQAM